MERQGMLVGLVDGAHGVVTIRRAHLLDVSAKQVHHLVRLHECGEPIDAGGKRCGVANVESAGVERVAGEKYTSASVVDRNAGRLMTGNRDDVQHPRPEVDGAELVRPASHGEERTDGRAVATNQRGMRTPDELSVARNMISMRVT